jgi:LmbE family N-acetylglucosaminyl deacetylase
MQPFMQSDSFEPYQPQRVLAVGAHADDIDFGASGSLALFARAGAHVEYLVITDGSKGSADLTVTSEALVLLRQQEQREAAKTLGAQNVTFLGYEDGCLEVTQALKKDIVRVIRQVRPDTVIVMDPTMVYSSQLGFINHPDHRAAGQATLDAVFPLARDHLSFPELYTDESLEPHKVAHLLLINLEKQNCFIDISETFDLKLSALFKHGSQIPDRDAVTTMLKTRAAHLGEEIGVAYAESFMRIDPPN